MQVYTIHPETGALTGTRTLPIDPLESERAGEPVYARPGRFDVTVEPPAVLEGFVPVWSNEAWQSVRDCRGQTWWTMDRTPTVIENLGDPIDLGLVPECPAAPPPTQEELRRYAASKRDTTAAGGAVAGGIVYPTDTLSRANVAQAIQMIDLGIKSEPVNWKTPAGYADLMRADLLAVAQVMGSHVQACFDACKLVTQAIEAGTITTYSEIDAAQWPANS